MSKQLLSRHGKLGASPGPSSGPTVENVQYTEKDRTAVVFKPKSLQELAQDTSEYSDEFAEVISRVANTESPLPQFEVAAKIGVLELQPEQLKGFPTKKIKDLSALVALLDDMISTSLENLASRPAKLETEEATQDLSSLQAELYRRRTTYTWLLEVYYRDVADNQNMALPEDKRQRRQMFEEIRDGMVTI